MRLQSTCIPRHAIVCGVLAALTTGLVLPAEALGAMRVVGTSYFADTHFPQFMNLWQEGWSLKDEEGEQVVVGRPGMKLGGYLFAYFHNTGKGPLKISDLEIQGIRMSVALQKTEDTVGDLRGASVLIAKLPKSQIGLLKDAGQPMWWKAEPRTVEPGGMGQIVVRFRRDPKPASLSIGIVTDAGTIRSSVEVRRLQPRFSSISFSPELDTICLYPQHSKAGVKVSKVLIDDKDFTAASRISWDRSLNVTPIVVRLPGPMKKMSFHLFRVVYADGAVATAGIRAWGSEFVYGMWGSRGDAKECYLDFARHNINVQMCHAGKDMSEISLTDEGLAFLKSLGMRQMPTWAGNSRVPVYYFLQDEPDAQDFGIDDLAPLDRLGCIGQFLVEKSEELRIEDPSTPQLLNINNTYKPENWYMYHQLADIPCIDPYYPEQIDSVYRIHPHMFPAHMKPTYVYATTAISQSSGQPKPLHVILCSTRYLQPNTPTGEYQGRYPTPEEKRMEVYYAIAAGAKGLSYWFFTPSREFGGCGGENPGARALWREIGLLGAEVRTAGDVITMGCPASLPVKAPKMLWVRALLSGADTMALIAVNDDVLCDRVGTVYKPLENATVSVQPPSYLKPCDVFEVTCDGIRDVPWRREGAKIVLGLGKVDLSRFVVITADPALKAKMDALYREKFAEKAASLKGEAAE